MPMIYSNSRGAKSCQVLGWFSLVNSSRARQETSQSSALEIKHFSCEGQPCDSKYWFKSPSHRSVDLHYHTHKNTLMNELQVKGRL